MAAISGTFSAAGASAVFTPTEGISEVVASIRSGELRLMCIPPVGEAKLIARRDGAFQVATADIAVTYQFIAKSYGGENVDIDYYMGP